MRPPCGSGRQPGKLLEERFEGALVQSCHLIVGFSGGADSVSLLYRLCQLRESLSLTVEAAHLNHCLRGEESLRDESFVRDFCEKLQIPLTVRRLEIAVRARERGLSEEECGREARYAFFEELADTAAARFTEKTVRIATAHTLSDDMETVLFRMARGTGLRGLCGIPAERGRIVRPLLSCTRKMVEDFCARNGLCYVTDSTNADVRYARNRVRKEAVPALLAVNSAAEESFFRMRQTLAEDEDYLDSQTGALLRNAAGAEPEKAIFQDGLGVSLLAEAPPALLHRAAAKLLAAAEIPLDRKNVLAFSDFIRAGRGRLELRPQIPFVIRKGKLRCEIPAEVDFTGALVPVDSLAGGKPCLVRVSLTVRLGNLTRQEEKCFWLQVITAKDWGKSRKVYENLLFFSADYDTIIGSLNFRSRRPGDALALPGRAGGKTLKKLYSEAGLSALDRETRLVAADAAGVLWADGFGVDQRAAVRPETQRILVAHEPAAEQNSR